MWKPIYDPGPWKAYLNKKENKGLPIMEVRKKYLKEQLEFEDFRGVVSSTLNPSLASSAPASAGRAPSASPSPPPPVPSIFPPKIYVQTEFTLTQGSSNISSTSVQEYIKYSDVGDKAWNNKPVYFIAQNVVDSENYDYNPNGVYGSYIRYNFSSNRWEVTGCGLEGSSCTVNILQFGVPIPSAGALPEWGNLIGEWDVLDDTPSGVGGCFTSTYVGPQPGPKQVTSYVVSINTYTEDPGTATFGTTYSYQENGKYILPESVYNGNENLACGEEPQPCNSLYSEVILVVRNAEPGSLPSDLVLDRSVGDDLINGRKYWEKVLSGRSPTPTRTFTVRWNGNNWELVYREDSDPEIVMSTNTNHTGEVPYDCSNIAGDAPLEWVGLYPPYGNTSFTTAQSGIVGATMDFRLASSIFKYTATSGGEEGTLVNGKPIYTVSTLSSDYVVQWNGANWEITKSPTGGSNPVVITTNTDVTYEWDELPNNVVTWTMTPGESVITTGTIPR